MTTGTCQIKEQDGFLKNVCRNSFHHNFLKCINSENYYSQTKYERGFTDFSKICKNDLNYYQGCEEGYRSLPQSTHNAVCDIYICEVKSTTRVTDSSWLSIYGKMCNGDMDCLNTKLDESEHQCDTVQTAEELQTGKTVPINLICNGICDISSCEDEAKCNGFLYGMYCKDKKLKSRDIYIRPGWICSGFEECLYGVDEEGCNVSTIEGQTCKRDTLLTGGRLEDPIFNTTRCGADARDRPYCKDYSDQTNCTDPAKVELTCSVKGKMTTLSKLVVCSDKEGLCDDNLHNNCKSTSKTCLVHKHRLCDGDRNCKDGSDENNFSCLKTTEGRCVRKGGKKVELPIPLSWLKDATEDCLDGSDERDGWPTCGIGPTERFVENNKYSSDCENVFLCRDGKLGVIEYENLCDGINTCGRENDVCERSRGFALEMNTELATFKEGVTKHFSLCIVGIESINSLAKNNCTLTQFIFPDHHFFGVTTRTSLALPNQITNCDHMYGELYLYHSCTGLCQHSKCPLNTYPTYESCPGQHLNRVGTLANNEYLTFFMKTRSGIYVNHNFVCKDKRKCVPYSQVCDLVDNCGDGSDEDFCTNHFRCNNSHSNDGKTNRHYIPKSMKCNGKIDCLDNSDECNDECFDQIIDGKFLKIFSWTTGVLAVVANLIIILRSLWTLKQSTVVVALINRSLILLVSVGDLLVGVYLLFISIADKIHSKAYCTSQTEWLTSLECSTLGIISTTGSQLSLFAMAQLSIFRLVGIMFPMIGSRPLNLKLYLKIFVAEFLIVLAAITISTVPLISNLEDFFVNGVRYDPQLKLFSGLTDKRILVEMLEAYYGRMKKSSLSWNRINIMTNGMFSHDLDYKDFTKQSSQVQFYGNDGVCLFKYFVTPDDPQRYFSWSIITINFFCFGLISVSYLIIGAISKRSSVNVLQNQTKQVRRRNQRMNTKISVIIATDFLCWVPFIVICVLNSTGVVNATKWYAIFSIIILPINSVINPMLYDNFIGATFRKVSRMVTIKQSTPSNSQPFNSDSRNKNQLYKANAGTSSKCIHDNSASKPSTSYQAESTV